VLELNRKKRIGLVLGGGGAKGGAHIAVIRGLTKLGIRPHFVTGCSAGALLGGLYAAGYFEEFCELIDKISLKDIPSLIDVKLGSAGLIKGDKFLSFLKSRFKDRDIKELSPKFACVATDINKGEEKAFSDGSLFDAIRASVSLPLVFAPFNLHKSIYLDGGLVDPLPIELCRKMGADVIVAVNLFESSEYKTEKKGLSYELDAPGSLIAKNLKVVKNYLDEKVKLKPNVYDISNRSIDIMQFYITKNIISSNPPEVLISPKVSDIGLLEFHKLDKAIKAGEEAFKKVKDLIISNC
jgi:NTE family protein